MKATRKKEDRKENRDIEHERRRQHNEDHDYKGQESDQDSDSDVTGHEQSPNIEKPYDPNNPDNRH